jgi:flagellar biosynthesis protein FlhF
MLFRGNTLQQAHAAAKSSLGDDCQVVRQGAVTKNGMRGWLGAKEFEVEAESAPPPPEAPARSVNKPFARAAYELAAAAATVQSSSDGQELEQLHREVRHLRAMLHRLTRNAAPVKEELMQLRRAVEESRPVESGPANVRRMLEQSGIDGRAAQGLIRALKGQNDPESLHESYRAALAARVEIAAWPLASKEKKLIALVGPPGVGKTTTAAKLGACAIADHNARVTFVAADTYRVGAIEQLARYAALMDAQIEVAEDADALTAIVKKCKSDVIIVDTAGRAPDKKDSVEAALGNEETDWGRSRHVLLCLPASLRSADADHTVKSYSLAGPTSICVTKLDITRAPGALVIGTSHSRLPVSTLCDGQRVPEDIAPATTEAILDQLTSKP